jgi:CheY-like chemotaxis protein
VRCLIVDDNADFVDAARTLLERQDITVVGAASSGAAALRCFTELQPDVTLVDINLGRESGFDVVEQLHRAGSPALTPLILMSTHAAGDFEELIATSPAVGFLCKTALTARAIRDLVR